MKIRNIFIGIFAVSCMAFSTACGQNAEWRDGVLYTEYSSADAEKCAAVPDYISAQLPADAYTKYDVEKLLEDGNKTEYDLCMANFGEFGRYDGLKETVYAAYYYPLSDHSGFLMKQYGVNQAVLQNITEVYSYQNGKYTLIDCTGDSYAYSCAICDGNRLYYLMSDGVLRGIYPDGGQRDYDGFLTVDVNEIGLMKMVGIGDAIEIQNYDGIFCGRVSVR